MEFPGFGFHGVSKKSSGLTAIAQNPVLPGFSEKDKTSEYNCRNALPFDSLNKVRLCESK